MNLAFESIDELFDNIIRGNEITFAYKGNEYFIFKLSDTRFMLTQLDSEYEYLFDCRNQLDNALIGGYKFKDVFPDIIITDRVF